MPVPKAWKLETKENVDFQSLADLGVYHKSFNPEIYENDPTLDTFCTENEYSYRDYVDSEKIPNLQDKLDNFKVEHIHDDDEIRYFVKGSGYFDVKNLDDEWVRIHCHPGDFINLPAGVYHRFIPDDTMCFFVMRLFKGEPVWTPHNRGKETNQRPARLSYVDKYLAKKPKAWKIETKENVKFEELADVGVFHKNFNPEIYENDPTLDTFCKENGYTYRDYVDSEKIPNLQDKLDNFKVEHIHDDDEIRYFVKGSGYFDVKNLDDEYVRIHCGPGDFVNLPAGIYHRFVPDDKMFFFVMRLFKGEPVWTPHNRSKETDERKARKTFVANLGKNKRQKTNAFEATCTPTSVPSS